jgi:hypothetical protein
MISLTGSKLALVCFLSNLLASSLVCQAGSHPPQLHRSRVKRSSYKSVGRRPRRAERTARDIHNDNRQNRHLVSDATSVSVSDERKVVADETTYGRITVLYTVTDVTCP